MVHGNTAYFCEGYNVYSYTLSQDKWTKVKQCAYENFSMAVVNNLLTTIGGIDSADRVTNTLLCISSRSKWERLLPPMPTPRRWSAAVTTPTHLIVAGGTSGISTPVSVVEILHTRTLQWSSVSSLPKVSASPNMTLCNGRLFLSILENHTCLSCSVEELLQSSKPNSSGSGSVWTRLADIPNQYNASLTTLRGQVLAIGGRRDSLPWATPVSLIRRYNRSTNSWSSNGALPTPRARPLVAVLPSHELIVVGGEGCRVTEIASSTY